MYDHGSIPGFEIRLTAFLPVQSVFDSIYFRCNVRTGLEPLPSTRKTEAAMIPLTADEKAQYLSRCFYSVDGLWFMKVEERYGFDTALAIDREVWKVLPKIQARTLKTLGNLGNGLMPLKDALETKFPLEKFNFTIKESDDGASFTVTITDCPWHNLMVKSGRRHLAEKVGKTICRTEYPALAAEFGCEVSFEAEKQLCSGSDTCVMTFSLSADNKEETPPALHQVSDIT